MIIEIILIIGLVIIFVVLARRIPDVIKKTSSNELKNNHQEPVSIAGDRINENKILRDLEIADVAFEKKDYKEAEDFYIKAVTKEPENPKIYNRLGIIYLERKNYRDAKDAFAEALKLDDKIASRHVNYGLASLNLRNYDDAIKSFETASKLDPENKKYQTLLKDTKLKKRMFVKK